MPMTITLEPEWEAHWREEARRLGMPAEQLLAQRAAEAELLWRIRSAAPEPETRLLHRLLRRQKAGTLSEPEQAQLQALLDAREESGAQRLAELTRLARLRGMSVRSLMEQLGVRPVSAP